MRRQELDPRFTFESFVIGAANRLAAAAARRVAESPGVSYNPLFIYSASGLGKTHLVMAIGNHAERLDPALEVVYSTLEHFMDDVMTAIEAGERDAFRERLGGTGLLLLDDVQFLAGRHRTQEELLKVWDIVTAKGGQVVLTSDRPPQEIDGLDDRLLSRFSGGLIVDIGVPDYETRVAIARRKAEERGQTLNAGVAETLARIAFGNVRELQGALNRLIAIQELEDRAVAADEVARLLGRMAKTEQIDEFGSFLAEISDAIDEVVPSSSAEGQLAAAIMRWQGEGYSTRRLESALSGSLRPEEAELLIREYEAGVERLREIVGEIAALDPEAPELGRREFLRDPDRLEEAESMLRGVRERRRPLPPPPAELTFAEVTHSPELLAVKAARAVAERPAGQYNPLVIHAPAGSGKTTLLAAIGNQVLEEDPGAEVAYVEGEGFAAELIEALEKNQVDSWRARYRRARVFLFDDLDALAETERAQDELFHLFDALQRAGAQLAFTSSRRPAELDGLEERLRTRLESGLVVELPPPGEVQGLTAPDEPERIDPWFLDNEKVVWSWPYLEETIVEEWD